MSLPEVVSPDEWRTARIELLAKEKAATRARDALSAERRKLPMVKVEKDYLFEGPDGTVSLRDLFAGRRQLIVYHFMFDPDWDEGCPSCSFVADNIGHLSHLHARDTTLTVVSRAPLTKIEAYRTRMGWTFPWVLVVRQRLQLRLPRGAGRLGHDAVSTTSRAGGPRVGRGSSPGASVFLRDGDDVFHTYSTYQRGLDIVLNAYNYLDLTPLGRQESWEPEPNRAPEPADDDWTRRHDQYT